MAAGLGSIGGSPTGSCSSSRSVFMASNAPKNETAGSVAALPSYQTNAAGLLDFGTKTKTT